jgi:hypothetical protein
MSTRANSPAPDSLTWGPAEVYDAAGVSRGVAHSWVARQLIPLPPGPGMGRERRFSLLDAVRIAAVAELTRLGISVSVAARGAALIGGPAAPGLDEVLKKASSFALILTPTTLPLDPATDSTRAVPLGLFQYTSVEQLHSMVALRFSGPTSFIFVDVSGVAARVRAKLLDAPPAIGDAGIPASAGLPKKRQKRRPASET